MYAHLTALPVQILLMLAERANLAQKLVRLDEEPGAQQKGEEVRPIGIIVLRRYHVLHQRLERARDEIAVPVHQGLKQYTGRLEPR